MNPKQYLIFLIVLLVSCTQSPDSQTTRQAEVAERGREVMPFDLERTTHIFKPLPTGGLQQVISDDEIIIYSKRSRGNFTPIIVKGIKRVALEGSQANSVFFYFKSWLKLLN